MKKLVLLICITMLIVVGCGNPEASSEETDKVTANKEKSEATIVDKSDMSKFTYGTSELEEEGYSIDGYDGEANVFEIPDTYEGSPVVEIGNTALAYINMEKVILGKNVLKTDKEAFFYCEKLQTVEFNEKINTIGESTFLSTGLSGKITIPDSVERIEVCAFADTNLEEVKLGNGVKYIGAQAFGENKNLKKVIFNCSDVEFEDGSVFNNCSNLTIMAPKGSTAEKYAKDNNINFEER
ncbi:MAG: leucine-rich repeat protein [Eubacterium sp.]